MKIGTKIITDCGGEKQAGEIVSIDTITYSIPIYTVLITHGKNTGETIAKNYQAMNYYRADQETAEHAIASYSL